MKILKSNYFSIFFIISVLLHGTLFYFFNLKSNEVVNEKELIVNILKIPNQLTDRDAIDLKKEVKPEVIKKYNKIKKKFQQQIIKETKESTVISTPESKPDEMIEEKNQNQLILILLLSSLNYLIF